MRVRGCRRSVVVVAAGFTAAMACADSSGEAQPAQTTPPAQQSPGPILSTLDAAEADGEPPGRRLTHWNEYESPYFTARLGGGFLYDFVSYSQDDDSKEQ